LTAPAIEMPPELVSLVEFLDLPLPDRGRLREIIRETYTRMAGTHTLKLQLDSNGVDAMAANLRGLTEEAAERAISQTVAGTASRRVGRRSPPVRPRATERCHHSRRSGMRQESLRPRRSRRMETA